MLDAGPGLTARQRTCLAWQVLRFKLYLLQWRWCLRLAEGV